MKRILKAIGNGAKRLGTAAVAIYKRYPARVTSYVISGVVVAAGALGIGIDQASVKTVIELALPILLTGELTHHKVSPVK